MTDPWQCDCVNCRQLRSDLELRDQTARDRKDIIARLEVEIERLRAREKTLENTARINLKVAQNLRRDNERLRAALREAECPGGGFNGMPKGAGPTVGLCVDHGACGCLLGEPLK